MNIDKILEIAKREFQQKLTAFCQNSDFSKLSAASAEEFAKGLQEGLRASGMAAYKAFIESYETLARPSAATKISLATPGIPFHIGYCTVIQ